VCVALFKAELNLSTPAIHLAFYSSRLGSYTVTQGQQVALGWLNPYMVEHYRLEVANDIFNGVVHTLSCRPAMSRLVPSMAPCCRAAWHYSGARRVVNRASNAI
jgi:hypothetical protein